MPPRRLVRPQRTARIVAALTLASVAGAAGVARAQSAPLQLPRQMVHERGQPVPAGYHVEHRTRYGLAISGLALFAAFYIPTAGAAYYDSRDGTPLYVVPVLGPLLAIPKKTGNNCDPDTNEHCLGITFDEVIIVAFIADAVVQAAGLVTAWRGFAGRDLLVRDDASRATLVPGPIGGRGYGAWLTGRF
jgi:hypothetical protein